MNVVRYTNKGLKEINPPSILRIPADVQNKNLYLQKYKPGLAESLLFSAIRMICTVFLYFCIGYSIIRLFVCFTALFPCF